MILNTLRYAAVAAAAALFLVLTPVVPSLANDSYDDFMGRMTDKRYDLERYSRAYTKTMRELEKFQSWKCAPNAQSQKEWTDYAEKLAKLLHDYASYAEYDDPDQPNPLTKRQEALDMASRLIGAYTAVRKLPLCPQGGTATPPPPPPKETPTDKPKPEEESEPETPPEGAPLDLGQLSADDKKALKCASEQEKAQIKEYQNDIKKLRKQLEDVQKPIEDADAEVERATQAAMDYAATAKPDEPRSESFNAHLKSLNDQANEARQKAGRLRREIQPQIDDLNMRMNDIDRQMRDLLVEISGRTSCAPPRNATDDDDDGDDDDDDDKGNVGNVIDNVDIGIGIGIGGSKGHGRRGGGCGPRPRPNN